MPTSVIILTALSGCLAMVSVWQKKRVPDRDERVATPQVAEKFFRDPANFVDKPVQHIFDTLGKPVDFDDWDLGRFVYSWSDKTRCVRIFLQGDTLESAVLMDPHDTARFGIPIEILWERRGAAST